MSRRDSPRGRPVVARGVMVASAGLWGGDLALRTGEFHQSSGLRRARTRSDAIASARTAVAAAGSGEHGLRCNRHSVSDRQGDRHE